MSWDRAIRVPFAPETSTAASARRAFSRRAGTAASSEHWIYYPEETVLHRVFVQGNASPHCNPPGGFGQTGEITYGPLKPLPCDGDDLIRRCINECIEVGLFKSGDPIWAASQVDRPFVYVVYDHARPRNVALIRERLDRHDVHLAGRYSEWEYDNSDHAFLAGKKAAEAARSRLTAAAVESARSTSGPDDLPPAFSHGRERDDRHGLDRLAALGVTAVRYPVLWERHAADSPDWPWAAARLGRLRALGVGPIVGLVHHGSGPPHTSLDDPAFAGRVAERFPWFGAYTPVNEPLTTTRFSGLYGHWFPHGREDRTLTRCLLYRCRAVLLARRAAAGRAGFDPGVVIGRPSATLGWRAPRPAYAVLASGRGPSLRPLADGLTRFLAEFVPAPAA